MSKYIGDVSAYAYAVSKGYTGTEEEFAELMASYADVGQTAVTAAQTATAKASEAATSATTATNKATEASTSATSASSSASAASASASQASGSATSAANSATAASGSATSAAGSATTASTKASEASASATDAATAKTSAEAAQTAAETAQGKAEDAQEAAEATAQSISASATQIATNTADITQLKSEVSALPTDGVVANSKQLLSENGTDNTEPYMLRAVPVNADRAELDAVVGGTVAWNQIVENGNFETASGWNTGTVSGNVLTVISTITGEMSFTLTRSMVFVQNHKFLAICDVMCDSANYYRFRYPFVSLPRTISANTWTTVAEIGIGNTSASNVGIQSNAIANATYKYRNFMCFDLTQMFGSTIADYIYSLEQSTAGAGVAFFRRLFPKDYYPYNAGTLKSVEGVSEKVTRDADNNVLGTYPLDSTLTLRGIPKLADGKLAYDGDRYLPDGTVERRYGIRAYQSGDESLADAITDGTNTVYKLTTPTTETADPYQSLQVCDPNGTEEFVTTGIVPVGHETRYPENLRAKIEGLPWDFSSLIAPTEKTTTASRNYTTGSLLIMNNVLYKATANIANGGTITPNTNVTATTLSEVISALQ